MKINLSFQQKIVSCLVRDGQLSLEDNQLQGYQASIDGRAFSIALADQSYRGYYYIDHSANQVHLNLGGYYYRYDLIAEAALNAAKERQGNIISSLPGKILKVLVQPKDKLKQGQPIVVQEAMKMQHTLEASRDCEVEEVLVGAGEQVAADQLLVKLK